jgi:hypothetical protein
MHRVLRTAGVSAGLACLVLLASGCERRVVHNDYFPMRDGNRWEYRLLDLPRLKALAAGQSVPTESSISGEPGAAEEPATAPKAEVVAETGAAPTVPAARRIALVLKESIDDLTFRATYDGLEQVWSKRGGYVGFQDARGRHYLLILPPHTTYRWVVTDEQGQDLYYEIEGQSAVTTPCGTYPDCAVARQESRDRHEIFRYWFAPGLGLVRRSKYFNEEEVFRQELVASEVRASRPETHAAEDRELETALKGKNRGQEHRKSSGPASRVP